MPLIDDQVVSRANYFIAVQLLLAPGDDCGKGAMDEIYRLLVEFEEQLERLHAQGQLTANAQQLFREFADEVERRTGTDRRRTPRGTIDRRRNAC